MFARVRIGILPWFKGLIALWLLGAASLAGANEVELREALVAAPPPAAMNEAPGDPTEWTWLRLADASSLGEMPTGWQLLIDQVRFHDIAVVITSTTGITQRYVLGADELGNNWAPGGLLKFDIAAPGREVRDLAIGFHRIDDLSLMRKVTAATPQHAAMLEARWLVLMGGFAGLLFSAFVYNLFVNAGERSSFQKIYLAWVAAALVYGLTWTNLAAFAFPGLAGPLAVRLDNIFVSLVVALGGLFLGSVIERGKLPTGLSRAIEASAVACVVAGIVAADERLVPARFGDGLLNLAMIACVAISVTAILVAIARRSQVVWLYLLGWAPVIGVFNLRAARNFGLVPQSDGVDLATFAAIAFESLVFSLLIAGRFVALRKERDDATTSARGMEIEKEAMRRAAHSDFLTGLGNRASFHETLRTLLADGSDFGLFLIDVDYLKEHNDRQGHDAGDALLRCIGAELGALASPAVTCSRIGGDEFAILCTDPSGEGLRVANTLDGLQGTIWANGAWSGTLSLSVGTAASNGATSPADLFQQADIALYEAKRLGRGRRQAFDSLLRQRIQTRLDLIKDAHWGLRRDEFSLHFQPIVDIRSGRRAGVEALLRWQHPEKGLLTPESFECVLADEEIGAAVQKRVVALAIEELRQRPGFQGVLAVNVTAMDLNGAAAARSLLSKLAAAGVSPAALCVEVTEGTLLGKAGDTAAALRALHAAGVRIALDDFGTGYASLVHLKEIPVDTLKIDKSFIAGMMSEGDESEEIVRAVLALGHGLKKTVIAEGVETTAQRDRLRELGCHFAQGYLFGRPEPGFDLNKGIQAAA